MTDCFKWTDWFTVLVRMACDFYFKQAIELYLKEAIKYDCVFMLFFVYFLILLTFKFSLFAFSYQGCVSCSEEHVER